MKKIKAVHCYNIILHYKRKWCKGFDRIKYWHASIVVSDHYERGYEPKRRGNISRRSVVYENRHYDDCFICDDTKIWRQKIETTLQWVEGDKKYKEIEDWVNDDRDITTMMMTMFVIFI
jgi:hypothetical protein